MGAPPDGFVRVDGRDYRGVIEIRRAGAGITVIERVGIESYLAGVVSAELGVAPAAVGFAAGLSGGWDWVVLGDFVCFGGSRLVR